MAGNVEAMSERTIRNVRRYLRAEGALSAEVSLPNGRGITVYRSKKIERALKNSVGRSTNVGQGN